MDGVEPPPPLPPPVIIPPETEALLDKWAAGLVNTTKAFKYTFTQCQKPPKDKIISLIQTQDNDVEPPTRTYRWIFWDELERYWGREIEVDNRNRILYKPVKVFGIPTQQVYPPETFKFVIPNTKAAMVRPTKAVPVFEEMPNDIVTVRKFLDHSALPVEFRDGADKRLACEICKYKRDDATDSLTAYCPCCKLYLHDRCCVHSLPVPVILARLRKCDTDNAELHLRKTFEEFVMDHVHDADLLCAMCSSVVSYET